MTQQSQNQQRASIMIQGDQDTKNALGQQVADFLRQKGHQVELQGQFRTTDGQASKSQSQTGQTYNITVTDEQDQSFLKGQASKSGQPGYQPQT